MKTDIYAILYLRRRDAIATRLSVSDRAYVRAHLYLASPRPPKAAAIPLSFLILTTITFGWVTWALIMWLSGR